ncbi:MAG TPA: Plug domain-containing protein [Vicinamibacterales bacterium]|jgi:outer membrane cobalamin receptor
MDLRHRGWTAGLVGLAGVGVLGAPATARSQTTPPRFEESVLVTPAASPVSFQALARHVWVLDRAEIDQLPGRSLADILAYAMSVDVRSRGPLGVQADFSLRGSGFGQVAVMIDGVRIEVCYGAGSFWVTPQTRRSARRPAGRQTSASIIARHTASASGTVRLPARLTLAQRLAFVRRVDGRQYVLWDLRVTRSVGKVELTIDAANLLDRQYQETRGVDMPGRWIRAGVRASLY